LPTSGPGEYTFVLMLKEKPGIGIEGADTVGACEVARDVGEKRTPRGYGVSPRRPRRRLGRGVGVLTMYGVDWRDARIGHDGNIDVCGV
jgi:hypothetical protein